MANKDDLTLDPMRFDSEMDFNFDEEMDGGINQEVNKPKSRHPITNVLMGGIKGTGEYLIDTDNYKHILKKTLPDTYGDIAGGISDATTGIHELYDQTFKELNPRLNSIIKKLDNFVPENFKVTKTLLEKADRATGGYRGGEYDSAAADEANVNNILSDVFQIQQAGDKANEVKQIVRDKIEGDRHQQSLTMSDTIRRDVSTIAQYTTSITQAYQKKSLELQIRSYMLQQQFSAATLDHLSTFKSQYEAITKNTALPEYVKISKSEMFEQRLSNKVMDTLFGDGSFLKRGFTKLKKSAGDFTQGISRGLAMVDNQMGQGLDARDQMREMKSMAADLGMDTNELTASHMLGANMAMFGMDVIRDKAISKIKPWVDENEDLKEKLAKGSKWFTNPEGKLEEFRESDDWKEKRNLPGWQGMLANAVDIALGSFADEEPARSVDTGNLQDDLDHPAEGFTKRASLSITTIIPGFLARIHREITMLRTGKEAPLFTYDYGKGEFIEKRVMQQRIVQELRDKGEESYFNTRVKDTEKLFLGDTQVDEVMQFSIRIFLSRLAREPNVSLDDIDKIRETISYQSMKPDVQELIDKMYEEMSTSGSFHQKTAALAKSIKNIKKSIPSMDAEFKKYIEAGHGDLLEKEGFVTKSADGRRYDVDEDLYESFLEQGSTFKPGFTSDVNTKTNIKPTSPSSVLRRLDDKSKNMIDWGAKKGSMVNKEAYEGFKKTKLFNWKYKKGQSDEGIHDGPMAQDVKANLGDEAAPNGKSIDIQSVTASFFSAIKYLGGKMEDLFKNKEEKPVESQTLQDMVSDSPTLDSIAENTASTAASLKEQLELLKQGGVGGTGGRTLYGDIRQLFVGRDLKGIKNKAYEKAGLVGKFMKSGLSFVDKLLGTTAKLTDSKESQTLSFKNLEHIRAVQQAATLNTKHGDLCRRLLAQFPEYRDLDTSDEAIEKAKANAGIQEEQPEEERTVMQLFASIAKNLMLTIAGLGTSAFKVGKAGFHIAKDNIVKPGFTMAINGTKHILSLLEDKTGGYQKTKRYTANDLINIRALITCSKIEGPRGIPAREMLKLYPEFLELDTSDEAIEKANNDPAITEEQDPTDRTLLSYVDSIVSNVGSMAFRVASNVMFDKIPSVFKGLNALKDKAIDLAAKFINKVEDLYIAGQENPVIRAKLLELGKYRDQATGKILRTIDDIKAIKGNIIDEDGNVILTLDDISKGLFNRTGEEIKTTVMKGLTKAKDFVVGGLNRLGGFLTGGVQFGDSKYMKETSEATVDIRDILLGDIDKVRERLSRRAAGTGFGEGGGGSTIVDPEPSDMPSDGSTSPSTAPTAAKAPDAFAGLAKLKDKLTDIHTPENKAKALEAKDYLKGRFMGNMDKAKGWLNKLRGKGQAVPEVPEFVGPMPKQAARPSGAINWGAKRGSMLQVQPTEQREYTRPEDEADKALASGNRYRQVQANTAPSRYARTTAPELVGPLPAAAPVVPKTRMGKLLGAGKGLLGKAGGVLGGAASLAGGLLGGGAGAEGAVENKAQEAAGSAHRDDYKQVSARKSKVKGAVAAKDRAWNDKDGDGERDGGVDDRHDKLEALKQARTKETLKADLSLRYKSGSNVLDAMLGMAGKFLSNITGVIGGVIGSASTLLSKIPGLGKVGKMMTGALAGNGLLGTVARGAWTATKFMGGVGGRAAMLLGGIGINAVAAVGSTLISAISAPVVLGALAIGGAAYGLYKLYQYANRNNANDYERLRLRQYGFAYNSTVDRYNHHVYMLEAYLEDGRVGFTSGDKTAYLLDKKIEGKDLLEAFGIDPSDKEHSEIFAEWFKSRFKPVFLAHQTAMMKQNSKFKLSEASKLKPVELLAYLEATKVSDSVYGYDRSPLEGMDSLNVNTEEIRESFSRLIEKARIEAEKAAKKSALPEKAQAIPPTQAEASAQAAKKAAESNEQDKAKASTDKSKAFAQNFDPDAGEGDGVTSETGNSNMTGMKDLPTTSENYLGRSKPPASAKGPILTGDAGMQFITRGKNVNLENLSPELLKNFLGMAEEYGKLTGKSIGVNDGKRSAAEQQALYQKYPGKAARPGYSLHEFGLAVDINSAVANELDRLGLMKKYGFTRPVGREPWHIEPAGIQSSLDQAKKGGPVTDAMVAMSLGHGGGGYGTMPDAAQSRRNGPVAAQLFNSQGVEAKVPEDKAKATTAMAKTTVDNKIATQEKAPGDVKTETKAAANDKSFEATSKQSKAQQVPNVSTGEGEVKPTETASTATGGKGDIAGIIEKSAKRVGVDPNLVKTVAAIESDMNPNAKAKTSSATGLMQFTKGTWNEQLAKNGPKYGLSPDTPPTDPEASALLGSEYIKSNQRVLSSVKPNPNATDLYLAHFLGAGGAKKFLNFSPDIPAADQMRSAAEANQPIFFDPAGRQLTFGEIYQKLGNKVQSKAAAYGIPLTGVGEGLKMKPEGEQGTGLKGMPSRTLGGMAANDPSVVVQPQTTVAPPSPSPSRAPTPSFALDSRSPAYQGTGRNESGQATTQLSTAKLETLSTESIGVQKESLDVLKTIASSLSTEELIRAFATALKSMPQPESKEATPKEKDESNMGRTVKSTGSSLDLRRRSA